MKKLILIPLLFVCVAMFGQQVFFQDSIRVPTGADTTVYKLFYTPDPWSMSFEYLDFDDTDAVLDIGESGNTTDGTIFNRLDDDRLPFTLADSMVSFEKAAYNT